MRRAEELMVEELRRSWGLRRWKELESENRREWWKKKAGGERETRSGREKEERSEIKKKLD